MTEQEQIVRAGELADADEPDEAMEIINRVLLDSPDHPGALYVAACVLLKAARHVQAIQMGKRITELCPKDPRGWGILALCFGELHRYDDSIRHAEKALSLRRTAKTLADAAYAHVNAGNWDLADELSREAMFMDGREDEHRDARIHNMYVRLAKKDWIEGFKNYRLTMRTKWRKEWTYNDSVEWKGEEDAVVMVTGEQGLGDEIMAASVIPEAARHCRKFIFDCDHRLAALFKRSFPEVLVTPTRRSPEVRLPILPTHHKSLFGLCELFRKKDADFHRRAFLVPNEEYVRMFRSLFNGQRTIGIAWSGGLPRTGMEQRRAGLNAFLPLIRTGEAQFVSLEYKDDGPEIMAFFAQHGHRILRFPWVTQGPDMDLLAGLISACDEVIGVATTSLHMAAALGVKSTILVNRGLSWVFAPDELLWYPPTTQMHRKRTGESWRDCIGRLVESRKERIAA